MGKITPGKAIRKQCLDCVESFQEVRDCQGDQLFAGPCVFYKYRLGKGRPSLRTIRKFCMDCMGGSFKLVRECTSKTCVLVPYRLGHRPKHSELVIGMVADGGQSGTFLV